MNVHERIRKTLDHEEPDRVPTFTQSAESEFISKYISEYGKVSGDIFLNRDFKVAKRVGFDSIWIHIGGPQVYIRNKPTIPKEIKPKDKSINITNEWHLCKKSSAGRVWYFRGLLKTPDLRFSGAR